MSLQGTLAALIREEGLTTTTNTEPPTAATTESWEAWIRVEGAARTKLAAYCFFNLCSTAYNLPPLMLTSELNLRLPLRSRLWRAETAWQWHELRQATPAASMTVHEAFSQLFASARAGQGLGAQQQQQQGLNNTPQLSSLANYILIHALLQHIYLLKQTSLAAGSPYDVHRTLRPEDVEDVSEALRVWQTNFENRHQQGGGPEGGSNGASSPLAYNASALLRLAYIRLYTDVVPPSRALETRDAALVASALVATPPLMRSLRLHRAVFQVVHALSMLVRAGVSYVARTKSTEWSVQHSCEL